MHFIYKWRKKCRFLTVAVHPLRDVLGALRDRHQWAHKDEKLVPLDQPRAITINVCREIICLLDRFVVP
jgi:hypothetical protein